MSRVEELLCWILESQQVVGMLRTPRGCSADVSSHHLLHDFVGLVCSTVAAFWHGTGESLLSSQLLPFAPLWRLVEEGEICRAAYLKAQHRDKFRA